MNVHFGMTAGDDPVARGWRYHAARDLILAEQMAMLVLAKDGNDSAALHLVGRLCYDKGKHEDAEKYLRQSLKGDDANAGCHYDLGQLLKDQGNTVEAGACFREAIRLNPNHPEAYRMLANFLIDEGALDNAAECLRRAIEIRPDYQDAIDDLVEDELFADSEGAGGDDKESSGSTRHLEDPRLPSRPD